MKKKLNEKFMLIAAIAIVVTAVCSILLFYSILLEQIFDDLKANAHVISKLEFMGEGGEISSQLAEDGLRITLIDRDGNVIYDSMQDEEKMENHRGRPEIGRALAVGEGRGMRRSATSAQHTFYYAMGLPDGNILRLGKESASIYHLGTDRRRGSRYFSDMRRICKAHDTEVRRPDREDGEEYCAG